MPQPSIPLLLFGNLPNFAHKISKNWLNQWCYSDCPPIQTWLPWKCHICWWFSQPETSRNRGFVGPGSPAEMERARLWWPWHLSGFDPGPRKWGYVGIKPTNWNRNITLISIKGKCSESMARIHGFYPSIFRGSTATCLRGWVSQTSPSSPTKASRAQSHSLGHSWGMAPWLMAAVLSLGKSTGKHLGKHAINVN